MDLGTSREKRIQQRLRGAQRRQVKEVDFGAFLTIQSPPVQPALPDNHSPRPEPPQELLQGPAPNNLETPLHPNPPLEAVSATALQTPNDANISAKRKKLDGDNLPVLSTARSSRSRRPSPRPDIYTIIDENDEEPSFVDSSTTPQQATGGSGLDLPQATNSKLAEGLSPGAVTTELDGGKSPKASAIGQDIVEDSSISLLSRTHALEDDSHVKSTHMETPDISKKRKRDPTSKGPIRQSSRKTLRLSNSSNVDDIDELSPEQRVRKHTTQRKTSTRTAALSEDGRDPLSDPIENEEAEAISDEIAAVVLNKNKGRRKSRTIPEVALVKDAEIDSSQLQNRTRRERGKPDRVQQRQPKKVSRKPRSVPSNKSKVPQGDRIPIPVWRLTQPTIYDEDEVDADILNADIPQQNRSGVNPIDTLAQVCQELVGRMLEHLEDCPDPALKREYKTKLRAVEAFGAEVQIRFLEHTTNLDNTYSLERRLRAERKKKLDLRAEILEIRAEREKVALRMDEIRIQHEKETDSNQKRTSLNTALHDIELAVDVGKGSTFDSQTSHPPADISSLEILLKRAAGDVSTKGNSGGILKQIRAFNDFLERAALALESRKV